jgi:hypothetical protein
MTEEMTLPEWKVPLCGPCEKKRATEGMLFRTCAVRPSATRAMTIGACGWNVRPGEPLDDDVEV